MVSEALASLLDGNWTLRGEPTTEEEFNQMFYVVTGVDDGGTVIESQDPSLFPVTWAEVEDEAAKLKVAYDNQKYARDRQPEYPSIADQLDYIYHNGIAKWKSDMVKPVKDAHPKPE